MHPAEYSYEEAAKALGLPSDRRLRADAKRRALRVKRLGHRTVIITHAELKRYARNRFGLTLPE